MNTTKRVTKALQDLGHDNYGLAIILALCVVAMTASGCGQQPAQERSVEARLETAVQAFETRYGAQVEFEVVVAPLEPRVAGQCEIQGARRKVTISSDYLARATALEIEAVVAHEMGHCELRRRHRDTRVALVSGSSFAYAASVMNTYAFQGQQAVVFGTRRDYYYNELLTTEIGSLGYRVYGLKEDSDNETWKTGPGGCGETNDDT